MSGSMLSDILRELPALINESDLHVSQVQGPGYRHLAHCGLMTLNGDIDLGHHWLG